LNRLLGPFDREHFRHLDNCWLCCVAEILVADADAHGRARLFWRAARATERAPSLQA